MELAPSLLIVTCSEGIRSLPLYCQLHRRGGVPTEEQEIERDWDTLAIISGNEELIVGGTGERERERR